MTGSLSQRSLLHSGRRLLSYLFLAAAMFTFSQAIFLNRGIVTKMLEELNATIGRADQQYGPSKELTKQL